MTTDMRKAHAMRMAVNTVADTLDAVTLTVKYERFSNCYHEAKEAQVEWLASLLNKLTNIDQGTYPAIGYLGHVGKLLKEYETTYRYPWQGEVMLYLEYMDAFVADGILAEHMEGVSR